VGVGSQKGHFSQKSLQNSKEFRQMLDFQRFAVLEWLWSGFGVALEWLWSKRQVLDFQRFDNIKQVLVFQLFAFTTPNPLIFNALQTSLKCLIFNAFTHLLVLDGWVKGRVLSKDKVRVLGGAKQTSKGLAWCRVLCKDRVRVSSKQTKQV